MIESVTNHMFIITNEEVIPIGKSLNDLLYKVYRGELVVKDVIVDPHLCRKELEVAKIITELFKKIPKTTYAKVLDKLLSVGVYVYVDEFLNILLTKWDNLKFADLKIRYRNPYNTVKIETHIKCLL